MAGYQRVLVDTDVISYFLKRDTRAEAYRPHIEGRRLEMSFMTLAELERWALVHDWGPKRRALADEFIAHFTVLPVDRDLCLRWAAVTVAGIRKGRPIPCADAWIAATALHYDLPLVTNNLGHFAEVERLRILGAERTPRGA